ncbi:hypothetical protein CBW46_007790 [Paenibacillus xerothermodurans]|uniref:DUF4286 family protein n=1 Tax=Paenibacillus xerothermodurans TaxID=1977292 RepID=A0A2W1NBH4_PAEXE|nr:hypothetical protein CBW46_007790 [Paenibacillus xerothermodurans]
MPIVFVEYQILPQHTPAYSEWLAEVRAKHAELEVYEGADQPGLFVEIWHGLSRDEYDRLKQERLTEAAGSAGLGLPSASFSWRELHQWVSGGAQKIHIWYFEKVK